MAKKITGYIKLQLPAGEATPAPPVGPALGQHGVNIMEFVKQFNAKSVTQVEKGTILPVVITVYGDRSFSFILKTPPAAVREIAASFPGKRNSRGNRAAWEPPWRKSFARIFGADIATCRYLFVSRSNSTPVLWLPGSSR